MIIFFDLETTGTSITTDRIVQFAAIKTDINLNFIESKNILINPTIPIPKEASDVHGITNEMVADKPTFSKYASKIGKWMCETSIYCGYNSNKFDVPLLGEEFNRCKMSWPTTGSKFIDVYSIFAKREKRDLSYALKFYAGLEMQNAHDAEADIRATIKVLEGQMFRYSLETDDCIKESMDENAVDFAGNIILIDNVPCFAIGKKTKGKPVLSDIGFANWMLGGDFPVNTKNVIRSIINVRP